MACLGADDGNGLVVRGQGISTGTASEIDGSRDIGTQPSDADNNDCLPMHFDEK